MKLSLEPFVVAPQDVTIESLALGRWYDSQPAVRRLWGIRHVRYLRVIIALEPTLDNDDILPVWLANVGAWSHDLQLRTGNSVYLELFQASPWDGVEIHAGGVIVADVHWRDATL